MSVRFLRLLLVVAALLFVGGTAAARPGQPSPSWPPHATAPGILAGNGYQLTGGTWQASGQAGGGGYSLEASRPFQGAGCCCTYIPCIFRGQ